jgi:hypothetical protein
MQMLMPLSENSEMQELNLRYDLVARGSKPSILLALSQCGWSKVLVF